MACRCFAVYLCWVGRSVPYLMTNMYVGVFFNIGERADDVPLAEIQISLELLQVSSVLVTDVNCTVKVFKRKEAVETDAPGAAPAAAPASPPARPPPPFHYPPKAGWRSNKLKPPGLTARAPRLTSALEARGSQSFPFQIPQLTLLCLSENAPETTHMVLIDLC